MRVSVCSSVRANACAAACAYVLVYLRELDLGVRGELDLGVRGELDLGVRGELDLGVRGELDLGVRGGAGPRCAWGDTRLLVSIGGWTGSRGPRALDQHKKAQGQGQAKIKVVVKVKPRSRW